MALKILSIDDSRAVHAYLTACCANSNYVITHAFSGEEGLKVAESSGFDLILLDWEMPGLNGPQVLEKIMERALKTPVIMLTTKNNPEDINRVLEGGAREYIMKPFTQEILFEKIHMITGVGPATDGN